LLHVLFVLKTKKICDGGSYDALNMFVKFGNII